MAAITTIRLPPELRARLQALSEQAGRSAHSLMVEAIAADARLVDRADLGKGKGKKAKYCWDSDTGSSGV